MYLTEDVVRIVVCALVLLGAAFGIDWLLWRREQRHLHSDGGEDERWRK